MLYLLCTWYHFQFFTPCGFLTLSRQIFLLIGTWLVPSPVQSSLGAWKTPLTGIWSCVPAPAHSSAVSSSWVILEHSLSWGRMISCLVWEFKEQVLQVQTLFPLTVKWKKKKGFFILFHHIQLPSARKIHLEISHVELSAELQLFYWTWQIDSVERFYW